MKRTELEARANFDRWAGSLLYGDYAASLLDPARGGTWTLTAREAFPGEMASTAARGFQIKARLYVPLLPDAVVELKPNVTTMPAYLRGS